MTQHRQLLAQLDQIRPASAAERTQWQDARDWVASGAPLHRTAKPATPPKHLVAYFPVVDGDHILLVDHKNAQRWLPPGGHVEPGEDPRTTVVRELKEELGLQLHEADVPPPLMVTVTETVGLTAGHVDVSLWYPVHRSREEPLVFDAAEFHGVRWFHVDEVPLGRSDPHLGQFLDKLRAARLDASTRAPRASGQDAAPNEWLNAAKLVLALVVLAGLLRYAWHYLYPGGQTSVAGFLAMFGKEVLMFVFGAGCVAIALMAVVVGAAHRVITRLRAARR